LSIDERIRWPVRVIYPTDPEMNCEASNSTWLERDVEYWNCPDLPDTEPTVLRDFNGQLLTGRICALQIEELTIDGNVPISLSMEHLEKMILTIKGWSHADDRLRAVVEFQKVADDMAVALVTKHFTTSDDRFTLYLAVSLLAGRNIVAHRKWLQSLQVCDDERLRAATSWSLAIIRNELADG
jgi:hypothetical protein